MDPSWIEFQAEYESIVVVPNFTAPKIDLLQDDYGPFKGRLFKIKAQFSKNFYYECTIYKLV